MDKKEVYVKVTKDGPYLIYGVFNITQKIIKADAEGFSVEYGEGKAFEIKPEPAAICRCGATKNAPFCDGSHITSNFKGDETASFEPMFNNCIKYDGPALTLADNEKLCSLARFCDAKGTIWELIKKGDEQSDEDAKREAALCPSGRLVIFDKEGNMLEETLPASIAVLEDEHLKVSGPLWLRGAIRVESFDGKSYEVRNRQTLCRCGKSKNKPFCDSTHAHIGFMAQYI